MILLILLSVALLGAGFAIKREAYFIANPQVVFLLDISSAATFMSGIALLLMTLVNLQYTADFLGIVLIS